MLLPGLPGAGGRSSACSPASVLVSSGVGLLASAEAEVVVYRAWMSLWKNLGLQLHSWRYSMLLLLLCVACLVFSCRLFGHEDAGEGKGHPGCVSRGPDNSGCSLV